MSTFEKGVCRREGQYWAIGYGGRIFRLKHTKGLACIAYLLRHPGTEFHALDLGESMEDDAGNRDDLIGSSGSLETDQDALQALAKRYVTRLTKLAFISPAFVDAIVEGSASIETNLQMLMDGRIALPLTRNDQQALFTVA